MTIFELARESTPGGMPLQPLDETGGYCGGTTSVIQVGKAVLDGKAYGERPIQELDPVARRQMIADARFIHHCTKHYLKVVELIHAPMSACSQGTSGRSGALDGRWQQDAGETVDN